MVLICYKCAKGGWVGVQEDIPKCELAVEQQKPASGSNREGVSVGRYGCHETSDKSVPKVATGYDNMRKFSLLFRW